MRLFRALRPLICGVLRQRFGAGKSACHTAGYSHISRI